MTHVRRRRGTFLAVGLALVLSLTAVYAQQDVTTLRSQLQERFDIVGLRDGVGLVPREPLADVRLVEVRDGAVAINGAVVAAGEVRGRLGAAADVVLRATYLDAAGLAALAGAPPPVGAGAGDRREEVRRSRTQNDIVRIGRAVTVAREDLVRGDVVVVGASATIDGEVTGDVTVVGGALRLGPEAVVRGDVNAVGGALDRASGARVDGSVHEVGIGDGRAMETWRMGRRGPMGGTVGRVAGVVGTLFRAILLLLGTFAVVALGGRYLPLLGARAEAEPVRAGLTGLLAEVLFVPLLALTIVLLAVSIVGIPLLLLVPFALVFVLVAMLVGFTAVSQRAGRLVEARFGLAGGPYRTVATGVAAIVALTVLGRVAGLAFGGVVGVPLTAAGFLVEYAAWTLGTGTVVLLWHQLRHRPHGGAPVVPPPIPSQGDPASAPVDEAAPGAPASGDQPVP